MIQTPLKRGEKCYWKFGDDGYGAAYFISLNPMPTGPSAVKIKHNGQEHIVKDFEVLTEQEKFLDKHKPELDLLRVGPSGRALIKNVATALNKPYSRVLRIAKEAREKGVEICRNKKDLPAKEQS